MSVWNKITALAAAVTLFAAPSFADGVPGQKINHGPKPLKAHTMTPPEPGCVLIEGNKWACPVPAARFTHAPQPKYHAAPQTRTTSTRTYTRTHTPTVTRRAATTTRTVATSREVKLDMGAFSGGVGANIGTEFYGGGGAIYFGGTKQYSGVLSHAASRFTFQHRGGGGGKKHHPRPRPCGCH